MPCYIDQPQWTRWHGLSGHLVSDSLTELHAIAKALNLDQNCFNGDAVVPHYQLPAAARDEAIAAGAIALGSHEFRSRLEKIGRVHAPTSPGHRDTASTGRRKRRGRKKTGRAAKPVARTAPPQADDPTQHTLF